ncbi:accessory factor UbiK family protein [Brytella acorum]|uniref:Accessory factor UbiK family protein n=1 Tax=Brytella acorum TaxID=2959299 RepID=A0AA35UYC8_9PROT|nr:accessory factor UbiK family protein [Brytella acorum]MDF3625923.1 accessory factor UbiK family protein [Brytella acorum]CAI9121854.1 accessory factor UbiK family protein [Brytella acorum]
MSERPRFFDDLAGVAGGAFSALNGLREEIHSVVRSRIDEVLASLDLVRREELDVVRDMAATARVAQEAAEARLSTLEHRIHALEAHRASEHDGEKGHDQHRSGDHA